MKRLRVLFAVVLLMMFFPVWRTLDYLAIFVPSATLYTLALSLGTLLFVLIPIHITFPHFQRKFLLLGWVASSVLIWTGGPFSGKATRHYELRHCGISTFAGFLYPIINFLPPAHHDDIEVRNQMCWVRKMVMRLPEQIDDVKELQNYLEIIRMKLLSPPNKYKATLPLIAIMHGSISASLFGPIIASVEIGKMFVDSLHFWKSHYTVEISELEYPWYAWPHSVIIKWEYGIIEKNWQGIVDGFKFEN